MAMNKCCFAYGKDVTKMLNKQLDEILAESKDDNILLKKLGHLIFNATGNVNFTQRMNELAIKALFANKI